MSTTSERLTKLQTRLEQITVEMQAFFDAGEAEGRSLTSEENAAVEALTGEANNIEREVESIKAQQKLTERLSKSGGRQSQPTPIVEDTDRPRPAALKPGIVPAKPLEVTNGIRFGFRDVGDFSLAVINSYRNKHETDERLMKCHNQMHLGMVMESTGADGGFAVPPDFKTEIMSRVFGDDSLSARCTPNSTTGNSMKLILDETMPFDTNTDGNSGVRAYWIGEAQKIPTSKPLLVETEVKLNKLACLVHITEEIMEDAPSLTSHIRRKAPEAMLWATNEALMFGDAVAKPMGFVNSPSRVRVVKEAGQATSTVVYANIAKMRNRMSPSHRNGAVWLINPDIETQLETMYVSTGASSGQLVYIPAGGISGQPYATLYGSPVIPMENCKALGSDGDIIYVNLKEYLLLTKNSGGIRQDTTMYMLFDQDVQSLRFIMRIGGIPAYKKVFQRQNGLSRSWCVTLEDRP